MAKPGFAAKCLDVAVTENTKVSDICHIPAHALRPPDNKAVDKGCPVKEGQDLLHSCNHLILCSLELLMGSLHNTKSPVVPYQFYK